MDYPQHDVAVFWDLAGLHPSLPDTFEEILKVLDPYGPITVFKGFVGRGRCVERERKILDKLRSDGVNVLYCPRNERKETLGHTITASVVQHITNSAKGPMTVVFVVGDRSYSYLAKQLLERNHHVVVLVRRDEVLVEMPSAPWPTDSSLIDILRNSRKRKAKGGPADCRPPPAKLKEPKKGLPPAKKRGARKKGPPPQSNKQGKKKGQKRKKKAK